jgi:hypothetical protein
MSTIKAKNIKVGDKFEGKKVLEVRLTDKGRVSFKTVAGWKRRPQEERVKVER